MNKLYSKIAALSVGLAMAIGVGVAVGQKAAVRAKAVTTLAATFNCGADGAASHADGSSASSYEETDGDYTLSISNTTRFYTGARDAKGNGCFKLGTSSAVASFSLTAPSDVILVKFYVAGYKANNASVTINGGTAQSITTRSNDGSYTAVEANTSSSKSVTFATTSTIQRAMIDKIEFYVNEVDPSKEETSVTITTTKPLNMLDTDSPVQLAVTTSPANLSLSYVSSNDSVVTVSNTGLVTPQGLGSATITVSFAGDDKYSPSNDTINVTVSKVEPAHVSGMTISEIVAATTESTPSLVYEVEGYVTAWQGSNTDGTQYGNFYIADSKGDTANQAYVYGANYGNACVWDGTKYTFSNNKSFLTNEVTSQIVIGSKITAEFMAFMYNGSTFEFQGEIKTVENDTPSKNLVSITLSGAMSKTSYTTSDAWDPSGLVVTANYDDDSHEDVTSSATWSYDYATPAAMGASDDPQSLEVTAKYEGKEDSTTASVTVIASSYQDHYHLAGKHYIFEQEEENGTCYYMNIDNATSSVKPAAVTSVSEASVLLFTLVGDDQYTITDESGEKGLYYTGSSNTVCWGGNGVDYKWAVDDTKVGELYGTYNFVGGSSRYLCVYNHNDWRTYGSIDHANRKAMIQVGTPKTIAGFSVDSSSANKDVLKGSTFDAAAAAAAGFVAKLNYTDSTFDDVTAAATWTLDTSVVNDNASLTVTYQSYPEVVISGMNVYAVKIVTLAVDTSSAKTSYVVGEELNTAGLVITGYEANSTPHVLEISKCDFTPANGTALTLSDTSVSVSYTNEDKSVASTSYSISVSEFVGYSKVTSESGLVVGDSYVVGVDSSTNHDLMGNANAATTSAYRTRVDGTSAYSGSSLVTKDGAASAGAVVVTLLSDGNGKFAFYDITNDKYLAGKTSTSSSNHLYDNSSLSEAGDSAWWTISFEDGVMSIVLNGTDNRVLGYNSGSPRFSTYTGYSSSTLHPVLFRMAGSAVKTSVVDFTNDSLKMNDPAYSGDVTTENCASNYAALKVAYSELSDAEKNVFQYSEDYSAARDRLEKWAAANHEVFVYGSETPFSAIRLDGELSATENSSLIIVISAIAATSAIALGALILIKKRKHN